MNQLISELKAYVFSLHKGSLVAVTSVPENVQYPNYPFDLGEGALFVEGVLGNTIVIRRIAEQIKDRFNQCVLQLRPLSSITNAEAIEVAKIVGYEKYELSVRDNNTHNVRVDIKGGFQLVIDKRCQWIMVYDHNGMVAKKVNLRPLLVNAAYQYLQQQGFALPVYFKGTHYTVERLVELGIYSLTK